MTDNQQLQIEFNRTKHQTTIKIALGVAGCITIVILAVMFQAAAIAVIAPLGVVYVVKQGLALNHHRVLLGHATRQSEAATKQSEAAAALAWQQVSTAKAVTQQENEIASQLGITKYFIETNVGTHIINPKSGATKFLPKQPGLLKAAIETPAPMTALPEPMPNVLDVMASWHYPLVVNGSQQSGKTNATIAIVHSLSLPTLLVSLRNEPQYHFEGLQLFSEEQRKNSIARGFAACLDALANYEPMAIVLDDFINLGLMLGDDKQLELLIATIATQAISHKKRVFFTMQSSTKNDFGLKRLGASLKQNFAMLEVPAPLKDGNLNVVSHAQIGTLFQPGDWDSGQPVTLPGKVEFKSSVAKNDDDRIAEMIANGESNYAIGEAVFGGRNAKIYGVIDDVRATL